MAHNDIFFPIMYRDLYRVMKQSERKKYINQFYEICRNNGYNGYKYYKYK